MAPRQGVVVAILVQWVLGRTSITVSNLTTLFLFEPHYRKHLKLKYYWLSRFS